VFLPVMWQQLPEPRDLVAHQLRNAHIPEAEPIAAQRFEAEMLTG
jgi:hypothetical protein